MLTGAKRREWMAMDGKWMIIDSCCGSFPHSLLSTSKYRDGFYDVPWSMCIYIYGECDF